MLTEEVEELGVVQFSNEENLTYVDWITLKETVDYMRAFDALNGDMESIICSVLRNI